MERKEIENKTKILNFYANNYTQNEVLKEIESRFHEPHPFYITFVNVDVAVKAESDKYLNKILNNADYCLIDGMPLIWISKLLGKKFKEKVSGSDFVPRLCAMAEKNEWSIFLLGGAPGVPEKAAESLKMKYPLLKIRQTYSPPMGFEKMDNEIEKIKNMVKISNSDILLVCLGCPKQEKFIYENYLDCGVKMAVCAGATIDFISGNIKRCPKWMSNIGLEWFYRFCKEPRRLFRRYFIEDLKIVKLIIKYGFHKETVRKV